MSATLSSFTATTSEAQQAAVADLPSQVWFACCCIALPVLWGVIVHLVFRRLRGKGQPEREQEAGWPDYQI
ncbi:MAG: hypothetical protein GY903_21825 [Fuerstiella sp.]|nr:hypothetical protein [Fuerstiella sp.]MCP4857130.1 hypothetical protein [Fuerstiella sp.]